MTKEKLVAVKRAVDEFTEALDDCLPLSIADLKRGNKATRRVKFYGEELSRALIEFRKSDPKTKDNGEATKVYSREELDAALRDTPATSNMAVHTVRV